MHVYKALGKLALGSGGPCCGGVKKLGRGDEAELHREYAEEEISVARGIGTLVSNVQQAARADAVRGIRGDFAAAAGAFLWFGHGDLGPKIPVYM